MCRRRLGKQRASRNRQLLRHGDDLQFVVEFRGHQFDHLTDGENFVVTTIENLTGRSFGTVDATQHRMGEILRVAVMVQGQSAISNDDPPTAVEDATDDAPFAWNHLQRTIRVRIAKMSSIGMTGEHGLFGAGHTKALLVLCGLTNNGRTFINWNRKTLGGEEPWVHPAPDSRHSTDRDETFRPTNRHFGDPTETTVHRDHKIKLPLGEHPFEIVDVIRIGMDVLDHVRRFGTLMCPPVEDRHVVTSGDETIHNMDARRTRPTHNQRFRHATHPPRTELSRPYRGRSLVYLEAADSWQAEALNNQGDSNMLLEGKVAIISGIGPGLGQELAYVFAREGADVVLAARTESKLQEVADTIAERWPERRTLICPTDIGDADQTQHLVDATIAEFGRVDCLVNSAYIPPPFTMFDKADFAQWRKAFDVTVFGTLQLTQQVAEKMAEAGSGSIVFINSMIQKKPLPTQSGYASSKGALTAAARMLAKELGASGIRVNTASMGWMWGPPVESYVEYAVSTGQSREAVMAEITKDIPLGIIPDDADCANAVAFLASDMASVITGVDLNVNGGEMMM